MKTINSRAAFSILLLSLGFIIAFLPPSDKLSLVVSPKKVLSASLDAETNFTADQVAKFVVMEDSSVQMIDLRASAEFKQFSIPGAVSLPYAEILNNPDTLLNILNRGYARNIFYSNGDGESNYTFVLARGLGYDNTFVMQGGLNKWFETVMNSEFKGESISARENALFETRTRARRLFNEINTLPDSLKTTFMKSRQSEAKKLDGGCE